jgi:hypothetical protein
VREENIEIIAKPGCRPLLNFVKTLSFERKVCGREAESQSLNLCRQALLNALIVEKSLCSLVPTASLPNLIIFQLIAALRPYWKKLSDEKLDFT